MECFIPPLSAAMTIVKSVFSRNSSRLSSLFAASSTVTRPCSSPAAASNNTGSSSSSSLQYSSTFFFRRFASSMAARNTYDGILTGLSKPGGGEFGKYYSLPALNDQRIGILLESAIRNCDEFQVTGKDIEMILDWENTASKQVEIPFKPARVLLQVPVDLVIDHSVQVDVARSEEAVAINLKLEFERNNEWFGFLKWGSNAFQNMLVVPPGSGIVHQVNLEYLARVVFDNGGLLYPDSVVGTDSHTTMVDGLGVAGWGVGGIEAEAAMLGQRSKKCNLGFIFSDHSRNFSDQSRNFSDHFFSSPY